MSDRIASLLFVASLAAAASLAACDGEKLDPEDGLEREELGTFTTDTAGGADVSFEPADGAVSALVYCGPYGYGTLGTAETITAPDSSSVFDLENPTATPMRVGIHSDILPMLLPVSPDLDLASGAYGLRLYFDAEEAVSVTCGAVYRTQPVEANPTVDLHLVFVGVDGIAPGLTAAEGETTLTGVMDQVTAMWSGGGLSIGTVTYSDFDGDVDAYTVVDGDEELGSLFRTVNAAGDRSITFFFVQEITDDAGATILGLAGGPPGTAAVGATSKSAVVVTTAAFAEDPGEVARIMAHEGGHFLGLFHTTEKDGSESDPLGDTPECSNDVDVNGILSSSECGGTGAENLMWWASSEDSTDMSADQGWVVSRSAAVH
ncbi:MAG: hypothetical protein Q8P41_31115 [Pseudomonadota bacterium]|nr:hypothetical protein [Pseudomonadota bacterium]